jgi:hypothetical protein
MRDTESKDDIKCSGDALDRVLCLFDSFDKLVLIESEDSAAGTGEVIVRLKPSDRFLMLLAALTAWDSDCLVVKN